MKFKNILFSIIALGCFVATRVMPREPVKSSDVALGPPSGMLMPYRWNPSGIMARTVTVPSVGDVIRTDVRHFTGWEGGSVEVVR